mmetsp:Transcript_25360/g.75477  ORF Transcript_25360/g.75477 Transcript_25360/m.75477 type:complete len:270 (-) Transcript_25360:215-1024(-)
MSKIRTVFRKTWSQFCCRFRMVSRKARPSFSPRWCSTTWPHTFCATSRAPMDFPLPKGPCRSAAFLRFSPPRSQPESQVWRLVHAGFGRRSLRPRGRWRSAHIGMEVWLPRVVACRGTFRGPPQLKGPGGRFVVPTIWASASAHAAPGFLAGAWAAASFNSARMGVLLPLVAGLAGGRPRLLGACWSSVGAEGGVFAALSSCRRSVGGSRLGARRSGVTTSVTPGDAASGFSAFRFCLANMESSSPVANLGRGRGGSGSSAGSSWGPKN